MKTYDFTALPPTIGANENNLTKEQKDELCNVLLERIHAIRDDMLNMAVDNFTVVFVKTIKTDFEEIYIFPDYFEANEFIGNQPITNSITIQVYMVNIKTSKIIHLFSSITIPHGYFRAVHEYSTNIAEDKIKSIAISLFNRNTVVFLHDGEDED